MKQRGMTDPHDLKCDHLDIQFPIENLWSNLEFHAKNSLSKWCVAGETASRSPDCATKKNPIDH